MDEALMGIPRWLIIIFFSILPILVLLLLLSFELKPAISKYLKIFMFLMLPLLLILIGIIVGVNNFNINIIDISSSWYYIISIIWFAEGIIFYSAIEN